MPGHGSGKDSTSHGNSGGVPLLWEAYAAGGDWWCRMVAAVCPLKYSGHCCRRNAAVDCTYPLGRAPARQAGKAGNYRPSAGFCRDRNACTFYKRIFCGPGAPGSPGNACFLFAVMGIGVTLLPRGGPAGVPCSCHLHAFPGCPGVPGDLWIGRRFQFIHMASQEDRPGPGIKLRLRQSGGGNYPGVAFGWRES